MSARVGVVLSGAGFLDGSAIHEAVCVLIALDRRGAVAVCMAPAGPQGATIDHFTGKPELPPRDMLRESARIARGKIVDLETVTAADLDALIFPGGGGAAKSLSTFDAKGKDAAVHPVVERLVSEMHAARKPMGFACISPVIAAKVLGKSRPKLTVGDDPDTAAALQAMGAVHHVTAPSGVCIDEDNRLVSTPCYMNDVGPWVVYQGVERMVEELLNMAGDPDSHLRRQMAGMGTRP